MTDLGGYAEDATVCLPAKLVHQLAEQHRPVRRRDTAAYVEQYLEHCPACDGSVRHIRRPGDDPVLCQFARMLRTFGINVTEPLAQGDL